MSHMIPKSCIYGLHKYFVLKLQVTSSDQHLAGNCKEVGCHHCECCRQVGGAVNGQIGIVPRENKL